MESQTPIRDVRPGRWTPLGTALVAGCAMALTLAVFDLSLTLRLRPSSLTLVASPFLAPLATAIGLFLNHLVGWLAMLLFLGLVFRLGARPLAVASASGSAVWFLMVMLHYVLRIPPLFLAARKELALALFVGLPINVVVAVVAYLLTRAAEKRPAMGERLRLGLFILLFLSVETSLLAGLLPNLSGTAARWGVVGAYLAAVALTIVLVLRLGGGLRVRTLLAGHAVLSVLAVVMLVGAWRAAQPAPGEFRDEAHRIRHVILLTVDTLRTDAVSSLGNPDASTPNIDRLAGDGIRFTNVRAPAGWTLPSFSSIMTGLSPLVHMTLERESRLPDKFTTLAERFDDAGYLTTAIGQNAFLRPPSALDQGFRTYEFFPKFLPDVVSFGARVMGWVGDGDGSTPHLTDLALNWVEQHGEDDFFLWLHYFDPHMPYTPPARFLPAGPPPPEMRLEFRGFGGARTGHFFPTPEQAAWVRGLYDGEVQFVDRNIGRFLDRLQELGIYDDALIVFASDHGEEHWEHASFEHGHSLYGELVRVPLILKLPESHDDEGGVRGGAVADRVGVGSITPTVMDLCGIENDDLPLTYPSLAPLWSSSPEDFESEPLYATGLLYFENRESIVFDEFKYIRTLQTRREELYEIETDPGEQTSVLLLHPKRAEEARRLIDERREVAEGLKARYEVDEGQTIQLDSGTMKRLKALGYVE